METQSNGAHRPPSPDGSAPAPAFVPANDRDLELLLKITPWHRAFLDNALDRILFRRAEGQQTTTMPEDFWHDVFVSRKLPLAPFAQSALYHIFAITVLWGFSQTWLMRPRAVPTRDPFQHQTITYYSVSEYLPALESPSEPAPAQEPKHGQPEYAKQRIVSVRRDADSHTQTIVAPPKLKLPADVSMPNMIAWTPTPAVPLAAATHSSPALVAPAVPAPIEPSPTVARTSATNLDLQTSAVEPAPSVDSPKLRTPADLVASRAVVEPPPLADVHSHSPNLPLASAVEAAPSLKDLRRAGEINIAKADVAVATPKLPVVEQRATGSLLRPQQRLQGGSGEAASATAPPPLQMPGGGVRSAQPVGQLLALGIHPASPNGPIPMPEGSRTGTFAAGPEGKSGARGTPDIKAAPGSNSSANEAGTGASGKNSGTPFSGITVAPGPSKPAAGVIVAGTPPPAQPAQNTLAAMMRPKIADIARSTARSAPASSAGPKIEDEVFGGKKYYSMTLNMPNLVSASGSWIIRFAELNAQGAKGELTAPVAMQKVDPAYPTELMRQRVEGTVVLYAVIHADGTVADVRVLRGVDDRLDQNARVALMKWRFRPGTKNGSAIDLEAVVQIPFVARQLPF